MDGKQWGEGITQAELDKIAALNKPEPAAPTPEQQMINALGMQIAALSAKLGGENNA